VTFLVCASEKKKSVPQLLKINFYSQITVFPPELLLVLYLKKKSNIHNKGR